jgi:hypothetical protein
VTFSFRNSGDQGRDGDRSGERLQLPERGAWIVRCMSLARLALGKAEFTVTSFVGKHEKFVTVTTDDPAQPEWVVPF